MSTYEDPQYITLDASTGNGVAIFRGTKPTVRKDIHKIVVESSVTGSGVVTIVHRGSTKTSRSIALTMVAEGVLEHHAGEETRVEFVNGPRGAQVKVTAHIQEVPL